MNLVAELPARECHRPRSFAPFAGNPARNFLTHLRLNDENDVLLCEGRQADEEGMEMDTMAVENGTDRDRRGKGADPEYVYLARQMARRAEARQASNGRPLIPIPYRASEFALIEQLFRFITRRVSVLLHMR